MPMTTEEAEAHEALATKVEEHAATLETVQSTLSRLENDTEEVANAAIVGGLADLDAALRREGLSLLQVFATFVRNVTGHDIKVEQTSNVPTL